MPLLDLKTKLKDLKFGTLAPYIQKDINNPGVPSSNQIQARAQDLERLVKMFGDKPGIEFATKQVVLEASKADRLVDIFNKNTVVNPGLRIANILAQVPVNRTGTHFLALGGGPLTNYYTLNNNAASEALAGKTVRVPKTSRLTNKPSELGKPERFNTILTRTQASAQAKNNKKVVLGVKTDLVDTRSTDSVNLLDVGGTLKDDLLMGVTFNVFGKTATMNTFRGFVQTISDSYTGNWQSVNYVGRMEQFFTYTGFTRTFNFQLVIPIFSAAEQPRVFNKINSLVSYTAPTYVNNLPQGTIVYMTMGNYLRTAGIVNSVSITVANDVPWSYSQKSAYGDNKARLLPQVITANIQFTPIHSTVPQLFTSPFSKATPDGQYINQGSKVVDRDFAREETLAALGDMEALQLDEIDLLQGELVPLIDKLTSAISTEAEDFAALFARRSSRLGGLTPSIEVGEGFFSDIEDQDAYL